MKIEVKRFKLEDGREGSYAPLGNGLIKMLFDDGSLVIVKQAPSDADPVLTRDKEAAGWILEWIETRNSSRTPWKKVSNLAKAFGAKRVTESLKQRMTKSLQECGIELDPPLDDLGPHGVVMFHQVEEQNEHEDDAVDDEYTSENLPNQITVWDASNIGDGGSDGIGGWLRCLKSTRKGDRQFIWEGSSGRGIIGVVTYSGELRNDGVYEGWGLFDKFTDPITPKQLLNNLSTKNRFDNRGIRALQGLPIRLSEEESEAIVDILGGLNPTDLPSGEPDYGERAEDWHTPRNHPAEKFTENAICEYEYLWKKLGLSAQPKQQVRWNSVGRIDLLFGNTVIEVKKSVNVRIGPGQIERYLGYLAKKLRCGPRGVRGLLIQKNSWAAPGVEDRFKKSPYPLELWSVDKDEDGDWDAARIL